MDPWDSLGSLSHSLGDAGPVVAVACHPTRPIVAACLSDGTIRLWDYQGTAGSGGRFSGGDGSGGGGGSGSGGWGGANGDSSGVLGGGESFASVPGGGSPPPSPPRGRGSSKTGKEEK